jgi:hypothetical protein
LGDIVLPEDDEFEFNPFDWAQASALAHAQTRQQLADLKAKLSSERDTIAKLNAQLDDFIETKKETETAMLQQFMELLNEKKRKIRDQSRLLAGAKVDQTAGKSTIACSRVFKHANLATQRSPFSQQERTPRPAKQAHHAHQSAKPQRKQQNLI